MDYSAVAMKKRKDEKAIQSKPSGMLSVEAGKGAKMETVNSSKSSGMIGAILKDVVLKKEKEEGENAVTEIEGEVVKWKAGQNPAYEERMMKLRKKAK